jgi:hypothetical protein
MTFFLRAVETTLRQRSPGAPADARFGAVAFVHRFGNYLNSHVHFHVLVTDGVFSGDDAGGAEFHPATDLDTCDIAAVQAKIRHRGLRWRVRGKRRGDPGRSGRGDPAAARAAALRIDRGEQTRLGIRGRGPQYDARRVGSALVERGRRVPGRIADALVRGPTPAPLDTAS